MPEQRADGGDRVHPPGGLPRVLDALELEPDRPRRHRAEHQHRHGDEDEHAEQRAREAADRDVVERVGRQRQQRLRHERHEGEQDRRRQDEHAEALKVRMPVRHPPAEPVADRQRDEHHADRVRPHDRGIAEERGDQAGGGDLRPERRDADDEDEQPERRPAVAPHAPTSMATADFRPVRELACGRWTPTRSPSSTAPTCGTRSRSSAAGSARRR